MEDLRSNITILDPLNLMSSCLSTLLCSLKVFVAINNAPETVHSCKKRTRIKAIEDYSMTNYFRFTDH